MTASIATLTYSSQNPVQIAWGDGTVQIHPASPPPSVHTVTHTFDGPGPWNVVLTDTVNGLSSSRSVLCTTCDITGAVLTPSGDQSTGQWTIGPVYNGSGGPVQVDWGDGSAPVNVNSGSTASHVYYHLQATSPGPFRVSVTDPAVPGCTVAVTGGNDPQNPGGDTVIVPPTLQLTCQSAGPNGEDVVQLAITRPGTYNIAWGDGATTNGVSVVAGTATNTQHTYALPAGIQRNVTVTQVETTWTGVVSVTCDVPPLVTEYSCEYVADCTKESPSPIHQGTPTTNVTFGPATQSWDVDWGDGSSVVAVAMGTTANHSYAAPPAGTTARYMLMFTAKANPDCFDQVQVVIIG